MKGRRRRDASNATLTGVTAPAATHA